MKIALFSAKRYDQLFFKTANKLLPADKRFHIDFYEDTISSKTLKMIDGHVAVVPFVNDYVRDEHVHALKAKGVSCISTRSAGYNHIDLATCKK
jgi:D-lactate dehydrogenase